MKGRAGRSLTMNDGKLVVFTISDENKNYNILRVDENLLSKLGSRIEQFLFFEISLKRIDSYYSALNWLKNLFFSISDNKNQPTEI